MHQQSSTLKFFCVGLFVCTAFSSFAGWVLNEDKTQLSDGYWTLAVVADGENLKITSLTAGSGDLDLTDVAEDTFGFKVTRIGPSAFNNKTGLTSICAPDVVVIEDGASNASAPFYRCTALTNASFAAATTVGYYAFGYCSKLYNVDFSSLTYIADYSFYGCNSLTNIEVSADITTIGSYAFSRSGNARSPLLAILPRTLPKLTSVGAWAFRANGGSSLEGDFYMPALTNLGSMAMYSSKITSFRAPSLTYIHDYAFTGSANLTNVEVSADITYIGVQAFARTSTYQTCVVKTFKPTTLPKLEVIGQQAFYGKSGSSLEGDFYMPALTNLGSEAMRSSKITSFRAPALTYLSDYAFTGSANLTNMEVSADITYIGVQAFARMNTYETLQLQSFKPTTLPKLEVIGQQAFFGNSGSYLVGDFYCPALTNIGVSAFNQAKITSFRAPKLSDIGRFAFSMCRSISNVVVRGGGVFGEKSLYGVEVDSPIINVLGPAPTSLGANAIYAASGYDYPQVRVARSKYLEDWKNLDGITFIPFETAKENKTYAKYLGTTPEDKTLGLITGKGTFWLVDDDTTKHTIFTLR